MLEKFSESIYENVIDDGIQMYKRMYESMHITEKSIGYWKNAKALYDSLTPELKQVFFTILEQTMIDTIATTFNYLDNGMSVIGEEFDCDVLINGVSADHDLKDYFLWKADELQNSK